MVGQPVFPEAVDIGGGQTLIGLDLVRILTGLVKKVFLNSFMVIQVLRVRLSHRTSSARLVSVIARGLAEELEGQMRGQDSASAKVTGVSLLNS